jgi:glutaconate CoA-transferase subunit A
VVFTDRLVSNDEVRRHPHLTTIPGNLVAMVIEAPFGAHPSATAEYNADEAHLARYWQAAESRRRGSPEQLDAYLEEFVLGPADHAAYRDVIGAGRVNAFTRLRSCGLGCARWWGRARLRPQ